MVMIGICEDDPWFADDLRKKTEEYLNERGIPGLVCVFARGEELMKAFSELNVVLMDIKLPGQSGMKIAGSLRDLGSEIQIIFVTSYQEYVFQAFDMDAVHYLLKPVNREKLYGALDKALRRAACEQGKTLLADRGEATVRIHFREIIYGEVFGHRVFIHTFTDKCSFSGTLNVLEEKLDGRFFRCHRSYLVNMDYVTDKGEGFAVLRGGDRVLISRRKQSEFTRRLLEACRRGEG